MLVFQGKVGFKNTRKKTGVCGQTVGFALGLVCISLYNHAEVALCVNHGSV